MSRPSRRVQPIPFKKIGVDEARKVISEQEKQAYFTFDYTQVRDEKIVTTKIGKFNYDDWVEVLLQHIRKVLSNVNFDSKYIEKLVSTDTADIWTRCFTTENVNGNVLKNYESLESVGDKIMGASFSKYMITKFPTVDEVQLNALSAQYVSKIIQSELSNQLELTNYVNEIDKIRFKKDLSEDLLEAFYGAIVLASEKAFGNHLIGYGIAYNLTIYLYEPLDIKLEELKSINPTNDVKEILEKIGLTYYNVKQEINDNFTKYSVFIVDKKNVNQRPNNDDNVKSNLKLYRRDAVKIWNQLSKEYSIGEITFNQTELAYETTSRTKKDIRKELFQKALDKLNKNLGLNRDLSDLIQDTEKLNANYLSDIKTELLNKITSNEFERARFRSVSKDANETIVRLLGVKSDGSTEYLIIASGSEREEAERRAAFAYIGKEYTPYKGK